MNELESGLLLPIRFYNKIEEQDRYKNQSKGVALTELNYPYVDCTKLAPFQIKPLFNDFAESVTVEIVCADTGEKTNLPYDATKWDEQIDSDSVYSLSYLGNSDFSKFTSGSAVAPRILFNPDTIAWFDFKEEGSITSDVNGRVSKWADKLGRGIDLKQSDASKQPTLTPTGVLLEGVDESLDLDYALTQPLSIYAVVNLKTSAAQASLVVYSGGTFEEDFMPLNTDVVIVSHFNGADSRFSIDDTIIPAILDNSVELGFGFGDDALDTDDVEVKELIYRSANDSPLDENSIRDFLQFKYSEDNGGGASLTRNGLWYLEVSIIPQDSDGLPVTFFSDLFMIENCAKQEFDTNEYRIWAGSKDIRAIDLTDLRIIKK